MYKIKIFITFSKQEHCAVWQWKVDKNGIFTEGDKVSRAESIDIYSNDKNVGHFLESA